MYNTNTWANYLQGNFFCVFCTQVSNLSMYTTNTYTILDVDDSTYFYDKYFFVM